MTDVVAIINTEAKEDLDKQINRFYAAKNIKIEEGKLENERDKTTISAQEAKTKRYEVFMNYGLNFILNHKKVLVSIASIPLLLWFFVWSTKLPYPSYR